MPAILAALFSRTAIGLAAIFGGTLLFREAKQTVNALDAFKIPLTIIAAAFLIKAYRGK